MSGGSGREVRRAAFQVLFQLDATSGDDAAAAAWLGVEEGVSPRVGRKAMELARAAWGRRAEADAAFVAISPGWPAHRQPAVDRAVLRLAFAELAGGLAAPRVAIAEAVSLAREFGGERSPGFVNALLDAAARRLGLIGSEAPHQGTDSATAPGLAPGVHPSVDADAGTGADASADAGAPR